MVGNQAKPWGIVWCDVAFETALMVAESLGMQLLRVEKRILDRRESIAAYAIACRRQLQDTMTSPLALLGAAAVGFVAGTLTSRPSPESSTFVLSSRARVRRTLGGVLQFIAVLPTVLPRLVRRDREALTQTLKI